jgi:hypothetical protein
MLLVEPIRAGRLRDTGWPPGLKTVVVCATVAFVLAVGIIVASPFVRAWLPLTVSSGSVPLSLPRVVLPLFFFLVVVSVALAQTAVLHVKWLVAIPVTMLTVLVLLFLGGLDRGEGLDGGLFVPGRLVALGAAAGIVALLILRRRRAFAWWEFTLVLFLVGVSASVSIARVAAQSIPFGIDFGPTTASLMMSSLGSLAAPAALAAGVAVAELAVTASLAVVGALRVRKEAGTAGPSAPSVGAEPEGNRSGKTGPGVLLWAFLALAAILATDIAVRYATGSVTAPPVESYPGTLALLALIAGGWIGLAALRRSHRRAVPTELATVTTPHLLGRLNGILFPVAAAFTALLGPVVVLLLTAQVLTQWAFSEEIAAIAFLIIDLASGSVVTTVVRTIAGLAFIAFAIAGAMRGRTAVPELLLAFGVIVVLSNAPTLAGVTVEWTSEAVSVLVGVGTVALAVVLAVQRRLGPGQLAALCVALLLAEAAAWRELLANPLSVLLGASAVAFILLGFVWGFVAGAEPTRSGSDAYPVPARVLLFLANNVFGVTALAFAALARDLDVVIDLDQFAGAGDLLLGTALIVVVVVALWAEALPRPDSIVGLRAPEAEPAPAREVV